MDMAEGKTRQQAKTGLGHVPALTSQRVRCRQIPHPFEIGQEQIGRRAAEQKEVSHVLTRKERMGKTQPEDFPMACGQQNAGPTIIRWRVVVLFHAGLSVLCVGGHPGQGIGTQPKARRKSKFRLDLFRGSPSLGARTAGFAAQRQ